MISEYSTFTVWSLSSYLIGLLITAVIVTIHFAKEGKDFNELVLPTSFMAIMWPLFWILVIIGQVKYD